MTGPRDTFTNHDFKCDQPKVKHKLDIRYFFHGEYIKAALNYIFPDYMLKKTNEWRI